MLIREDEHFFILYKMCRCAKALIYDKDLRKMTKTADKFAYRPLSVLPLQCREGNGQR